MSLTQKSLTGFFWTLSSRVGTRLSIFVVGIVLARILTPEDFGLIAMLSVFFAISSSLVDSGFTNALIRENTITEKDKSTVFYINLIVSLVLYVILWFGSPAISNFFNQPELIWLTRIMGLDIIFKALTITQRAVFLHSLRFKILSSIDIGVSILTGIIAIYLAYIGMGVWALAIKYFLASFFISILFFVINPWIPKGFIYKESFDRLFGFGSKLLITGLFNTFYNNIYNLIIGKFYSPDILGYYNRAFILTSQSVTTVLIALQQVTYPILSKTKGDKERLKSAHQRIIKVITFINLPIVVILAFVAEPLIIVLLGEKWLKTVPFLQLLCVSASIIHIRSINKNLFKVIGRSDLFLRVSVYGKVLATLAIIIGIQIDIWGLIIGSILAQFLEVFISMYYISKNIDYKLNDQLKDILPSILLLIPLLFVLTYMFSINFNYNIFKLLSMIIIGTGTYLMTAYISRSEVLVEIRLLILSFSKNKKN